VNAAGNHGHAVDDHMGDARDSAAAIERGPVRDRGGTKIAMSKPGPFLTVEQRTRHPGRDLFSRRAIVLWPRYPKYADTGNL
jgi:hypothetical protein